MTLLVEGHVLTHCIGSFLGAFNDLNVSSISGVMNLTNVCSFSGEMDLINVCSFSGVDDGSDGMRLITHHSSGARNPKDFLIYWHSVSIPFSCVASRCDFSFVDSSDTSLDCVY